MCVVTMERTVGTSPAIENKKDDTVYRDVLYCEMGGWGKRQTDTVRDRGGGRFF